MNRRAFLTSSASAVLGGAIVGSVRGIPEAEAQPAATNRALAALQSARGLQVAANVDRLNTMYHPNALVVEPGSIKPVLGRATILSAVRKSIDERKMLYFYYRQPQTLTVGKASLVVSNYEAGYTVGGKTVEDSGKTANVVLLGGASPTIAEEVVVPNIYAGSYGAMGAALARPRFGKYPISALGPPPHTPALSAGGGESDVLFGLVRQINAAWVGGRPADLMKLANPSGTFLIGDYSPYYITGRGDIEAHFADFYRDGRVNSLQELNPIVRNWGDMAAVAFDFDLDYVVGGQQRRSPGRAVYTFAKNTTPNGARWRMAACAASHLVLANIGDPYPLPNN